MDLHFHRALAQAHLRGDGRVGQLLKIASDQHLARKRREQMERSLQQVSQFRPLYIPFEIGWVDQFLIK